MLRYLFNRLDNYQTSTPQEIDALERLTSPVRVVAKGEDIVQQQQPPNGVHILLEGWASRYKVTREGKYQTLAFLMPGDIFDLHINLIDRMDHSIVALTPCRVITIPNHRVEALYEQQPRLSHALFWSTLVDLSTLREWLVNVGSRPSAQRLAHLLCELLIRARTAGLTNDLSFELPITQRQLGEAMGITSVHMSRVMSKLRKEDMITLNDGRLEILDWEKLKEFGDFEPTYLHLDRAHPDLAKDL